MTLATMGCDPHLDTVTAAVVNPVGGEMETVQVPNGADGWNQLTEVCRRLEVTTVGIEGASGYGRGLATALTTAGITVTEVPTRVTAATRRIDGAGKTDPGDARTIARAVQRGDANPWTHHPDLETIRVLTHRREALVREQTRDVNQLRALITEVDPARAATLGRLRSHKAFRQLQTIDYPTDNHHRTVASLIQDLADDCDRRLTTTRNLTHRLQAELPPAGQTLIDQIHGCGVITASQILAEIAGTDGFATHPKMAAWAGTAPLDASSGRQQHHRLNPGGNRQANRAIHTIVITQLHHHGPAHTYITRRISEGKTKKEAIRAAKRHLTRRIWKILHNHQLT